MKRVRTPRVIQMEALECGVVALSIILRYYGRYVPLEMLRAECGVSRNGTNAANLLRVAEKYGLEGQAYRKTAEELKEEGAPAILFWAYSHFLVLEGFGKNKVYLNDPATGPRTISWEEFEMSYSGIVLTFTKTDKFEQKGKPPSFMKEVWEKIRIAPYPLFFTFLTGICLILPGFTMPAFLSFFIDSYFVKNFLPAPLLFLEAVFLTALFTASLTWLRSYCLQKLNIRLSLHYFSAFLWHLLRLPLSFYQQRYYGEIASRTMLNESIIQTITGSLLSALVDLILILFYGFLMFAYDPIIALLGLSAGFLSLVTMMIFYRSRSNTYACLQQDLGKASGVAIGGLQSIESIKVKASESDFFARWAGTFTRTINARQEIGKKDAKLNTVPLFFQLMAGAALLGIGSFRVMEGTLSIGMLMSLQLILVNFLTPITRFVGLSELIQNMKINLNRVDDVMKNPVDPCYLPKPKSKISRPQLTGRLEFKNVTFGYVSLNPPLIENLSFVIEPGKRLGLVGPTGSGKSTVANLAAGLYHRWSGEILYDGIPIEELDRDLLSNSMASVEQSIFLFEGTIRENLSLWNSRIPEEILITACQDAAIHEEILARTGGYDSLLIEGGRNMSGGQRQRLEIARALIYNPTFLILDEATSALDSKVEKEILDRIRRRGCSTLIIAHRLATVQDCNEILVLDQGKVLQRGSHEELKQTPGLYQDLLSQEMLNE